MPEQTSTDADLRADHSPEPAPPARTGEPTVVFGNQLALAKMRAIVRRSSMYVREPVEGLVGANGRPTTRESYGGVIFADAGNKAGTNDPIIPVYDPDSAVWTVTLTGSPTGGTFSLKVTVDGDEQETGAIAYNATTGTVDTAIEALSNVPASGVAVTGSAGAWVLTFGGDLANIDVTVALEDNGLTGGSSPSATVAETGNTGGLTDLYAVRIALDGFHGVSTVGSPLVQTWLPDFTQPGAVKKGEVELGPVSVALKATKAAAVFRRIRVR